MKSSRGDLGLGSSTRAASSSAMNFRSLGWGAFFTIFHAKCMSGARYCASCTGALIVTILLESIRMAVMGFFVKRVLIKKRRISDTKPARISRQLKFE